MDIKNLGNLFGGNSGANPNDNGGSDEDKNTQKEKTDNISSNPEKPSQDSNLSFDLNFKEELKNDSKSEQKTPDLDFFSKNNNSNVDNSPLENKIEQKELESSESKIEPKSTSNEETTSTINLDFTIPSDNTQNNVPSIEPEFKNQSNKQEVENTSNLDLIPGKEQSQTSQNTESSIIKEEKKTTDLNISSENSASNIDNSFSEKEIEKTELKVENENIQNVSNEEKIVKEVNNQIVAPEIPPLDQNEFENKKSLKSDSFFEKKEEKVEVSNTKQEDSVEIKQNKNERKTLDNIQKVQISKPHVRGLKKRKTINFKAFTIGCSVIFILIFGIITGALYYFIKHPDLISTVMSVNDIKSLLKIFSTTFFGFLFFAGFVVSVLNGYRLATLKDVPKIKFTIGLILGLFILFSSLVGGITILQHINAITGDKSNKVDDVLLIKIPSKDGMVVYNNMTNIPLLAPMQLKYSLNPDIINKVLAEKVGNNPTTITLDCGNGQTIPLGNGLDFVGSCLYQKKGDYNLKLNFDFVDKSTNSPKKEVLDIGLYFASEISLKTADGPYTLSDDKTEINMGKAPDKVFFDARKVFSDLKLGTYKILRDTDADGKFDVFDDVEFAHTYTEPKIQTVYFSIPELGDFTYSLVFRVEQSDVPVCTVSGNVIKDVTYMIKANCTKENGPISRYKFLVYDYKKNTEVDSINSDDPEIKYSFPTKGDYYIKLKFITDEGKKGRAESNKITVGNIDYKVLYDLKYRGANDDERMPFDSKTKNIFDAKSGSITLREIPIKLKLNVSSISPIIPGTQTYVSHMGKPVLPDNKQNNSFQVNIQDDKKQYINIRVFNPELQIEKNIKIPVFIHQTEIIGSLKAFPATVGETPFNVKLNASNTKVTDEDDKIVYFTRDFDDGEKNKNTSQGIIEHIYTYNDLKENGEYNPKVTVKTSKGLTKTIYLDKPILVKKPMLRAMILIDSHPGQIANKGDKVLFSIRTDGQPEKVKRDFGDGEVIEMEGRAGIEQEHIYNVPGEYKIKVSIVYDNKTISNPVKKIIIDDDE